MGDTEQAAADLSMLDSLTGLWNRRALLAGLRERITTQSGSLILLDLDGYKKIAEQVGRENTDRLLLDVTGRVLSCGLGQDPLFYRYGGDAFALLLPDKDRDQAIAMAEKLRGCLAGEPFPIPEYSDPEQDKVAFTASFAVASYPTDARSPSALIETVERALFVAKRTGKNKVAVAGRLDPRALAEIGIFRGLPCPIFVGRAPEQARLRQLATTAREVGPTLVVISGSAGMGKSRLMQEICRWARAERFIVLGAVCTEYRTTSPYAVLAQQIERLMNLESAVGSAAVEKLTPLQRSMLSDLVREISPPSEPVTIPAEERGRATLEAWGVLLDVLSRVGPLVLAVDEVEYADEATLEVYRLAIERRVPLLLIATTDQPWTELGLTAAGEFFHEHEVAQVALDPLSVEDIRQMVSAILPGADVAPDTVEQLVTQAAGTPLYVEEAIRGLLLRGRLCLVEGQWTLPALVEGDLPKDLDAAIRTVVQALPAGANELLTRAAVIGPRVESDLLQEVLGQREAEALDFIDEARRARLLLSSEGEEDVLSFPAAHARRVRLGASDALECQAIHSRVGIVQEARHGADVAHLADELAYHYERAGDETRARHFDEVAHRRAQLIQPPTTRKGRRARITPLVETLHPSATEHALTFMRHFITVVKMRRLYPQWSQVSKGFLDQLQAAIRALFETAPGFTVTTSPTGQTLNGQPAKEAVVADFAALLEERLVQSLTIVRGFDVTRLERLVELFVEPFDRLRAARDHWDRVFQREKLEQVDLVQKAFETQRAEGRSVVRQGVDQVPVEHLSLLREGLRYIKAAVDNLRLYPPGHALVEESTGLASRTLVGFVGKVPALTLGTADGDLIINRTHADKRYFGEVGSWLAREIDHRELKSISMWEGLSEDEVRGLISALSMPVKDLDDQETRARLLSQFQHVALASVRYERAEAGGAAVAGIRRPPRPIRAELRARAHLGRAYDKFLTTDLEQEFHVLVESLTYGAGRPLAEQLVDRVGEHFHDSVLGHRRQAFRLVEHAIAFASPSTRQLEVVRTAPPLRKRLAEDTLALHFSAASNLLPLWIPAAVSAGCLVELAEVAARTLRKRADAPDTAAEIKKLCETGLSQIMESRSFDRVLGALRKAAGGERRAAVEILLAIGGSARRMIVESVMEEADIKVRRELVSTLAAATDALVAEFAALLVPSAAPEVLGRILEVIDVLGSPALAVPLASLLDHPLQAVRDEVVRVARLGPKAVTLTVARRLLASPQREDRDAGIDMATVMKLSEVSAEIGRVLEQTQIEKEIELCCRYFASTPNGAVVPKLVEIARRRPRLFGMVKGYSAQTRAAAVTALAAQRTTQAQKALAEAVADPEVKALAKL